ncbi:peptide-methionine (S)-S-oxide reductase [Staphylococcus warneri]|nr:peptide-methionine (S)-S-oxide reductase [Staphylococcus warneri]
METVYVAGGCLWGVQAFFKTIPGIVLTEAGRANGTTSNLNGDYDGYAECVKLTFDPDSLTIRNIMAYLFEVIDPYSLNQQGQYIGKKYRTGLYSENAQHLNEAQNFINEREDSDHIVVEVLPLSNYVKSAPEHQDRLEHYPEDHHMCHIPMHMLNKYK